MVCAKIKTEIQTHFRFFIQIQISYKFYKKLTKFYAKQVPHSSENP